MANYVIPKRKLKKKKYLRNQNLQGIYFAKKKKKIQFDALTVFVLVRPTSASSKLQLVYRHDLETPFGEPCGSACLWEGCTYPWEGYTDVPVLHFTH